MKKTLLTLFLSSILLSSALADPSPKPGILPGGCYAPPAGARDVSFSPLQSSVESVNFLVTEGESLEKTSVTFFPKEETRWSQGGNYWLHLKCLSGDYHPAVGFKMELVDGKISSSGEPFRLLLEEFKDQPRPLQLVVECSVTRYAAVDSEAEELGKSAPLTLTVR